MPLSLETEVNDVKMFLPQLLGVFAYDVPGSLQAFHNF